MSACTSIMSTAVGLRPGQIGSLSSRRTAGFRDLTTSGRSKLVVHRRRAMGPRCVATPPQRPGSFDETENKQDSIVKRFDMEEGTLYVSKPTAICWAQDRKYEPDLSVIEHDMIAD